MLTRKNLIVTLLASTLALFGTALAQDEAVLEVNEETALTEAQFETEFERAIRGYAAQQGIPFNEQTRAAFEQFEANYLEQLAGQEALLREAEARGIDASEDVDAAVTQFREQFETDEAYQEALAEQGFENEDEFRSFVQDQLTVQRTIEQLRGEMNVTDEDVRAFYDENQDRFTTEAGEVAPFEQVQDVARAQLEAERLNERVGELQEQYGVTAYPERLEAEAAE